MADILQFPAKAAPPPAVADLDERVLVEWLRIANGTGPARRDFENLLERTPAALLVGLALGLQATRSAHRAASAALSLAQSPCYA